MRTVFRHLHTVQIVLLHIVHSPCLAILFSSHGELHVLHVYVLHKGAQIPLKNEDGNFFIGTVLEIGDASVKIDLNHPLAGKKLNFKGYIIENREATMDEIKTMLSHMNGGGCGGDCGGCEGGCEGGCGHHDHEGGCCGKHEHKGECGNHEHKGGCCGHHN